MRAPLPADEAARLTSLHGYEILDTPPEQVFEDLVRLASTVSGMPVALISLVDAERQWFKARLGLDLRETPREFSFCSHAILEDGVFVVEDASHDPRFADNPYVTGDPRVRFYAGAPIRTRDGHSLGTVCVLGQVPSSLRPEQRRALSELAALVADQLEQRAAAWKLKRELALSAARLRAATDSLPFGLWMRDPEHRCVLQNSVARAQRGDLLGTRPQEADVPAELKQQWEEEGRRAMAGEIVRGERVQTSAGSTRIIDRLVVPVRDGGRVLGYLGFNIDITDRKLAETALRESEVRFRNMAEHAPLAVWVTDASGACTYINRRWEALTGQRSRDAEDEGWLTCVHPEDRPTAGRRFTAASIAQNDYQNEYRVLHPSGTWRWVLSTAAPRYGDDGTFLGYVGSVIDVDERRRAEEALRQSEGRLRRAQEAGGIGDWELNLATGEAYWSDRLFHLLGMEPGQLQPSLEIARHLIHPEDRDRVVAEMDAAVAGLSAFDSEFRILRADGAVRWMASRAEVALNAHGRPSRLVGVNFDVTDRKEADERIRELALQDPLTGLSNRRMLLAVLARELARARREGCALSLLLVDLDDFKGINDTLGHTAGDELLVLTAQRLQACLRNGDHVARLGGDEFAVVAVGAGGPDAPGALASRIVEVLGQPAELRGVEIRPGASVGIVIWPSDGADAEALLARADLALYAAKEAGRGTWRFFEAAMQERARTIASLDRDLRRALERGEFVLHFQPIVELQAFRLRGFEALLRWRHPDRGLTAPGAFLPQAERNRLIVPLTYWTVAEALRHAAAWRAGGAADAYVSVNLAVPALAGDGLIDHVTARLRSEGLPADALLAEVTEGAMAEGERVMAMLAQLREAGVRIGIDDFGAGYSSLARLRDLPFDLLKIDRAFLAGSSTKEEAILRAVVELARGLDVPTVAEGVETRSQLALLRRVGACCTQGFLIAPPMPADAIVPWVREWEKGRFRVMHANGLSHTENARSRQAS